MEPEVSATFTLEWLEEPCDRPSRTVPGLRFCTEVEVTIEAECEDCTVEFDSIFTDEVTITPHRLGSLPVTLRMTRADTGEVHEEVRVLDVGLADRLELVCVHDFGEPGEPGRGEGCRVQSNGSGERIEFILYAYRGDDVVALNLDSLTTSEDLGFESGSDGQHRGSMPAPTEPTTVTVTTASGVTTSLHVVP